MNLRTIFRNAFSTQHSHEPHTHEDTAQLFGTMAILAALIPGAFLFLYLIHQPLPAYARYMGYVWMLYAEALALGLVLLEHHSKKASAHYFTVAGVIGLLTGTGFFISGILSLFTGLFMHMKIKKGQLGAL